MLLGSAQIRSSDRRCWRDICTRRFHCLAMRERVCSRRLVWCSVMLMASRIVRFRRSLSSIAMVWCDGFLHRGIIASCRGWRRWSMWRSRSLLSNTPFATVRRFGTWTLTRSGRALLTSPCPRRGRRDSYRDGRGPTLAPTPSWFCNPERLSRAACNLSLTLSSDKEREVGVGLWCQVRKVPLARAI